MTDDRGWDYDDEGAHLIGTLRAEITSLCSKLTATQAELAKAREDFALLKAGRDANETYLLAELAHLRARVVEVGGPVVEGFDAAYRRSLADRDTEIFASYVKPLTGTIVRALSNLVKEAGGADV